MKPTLNKEFLKLVTNQNFIDWVNHPTSESDGYWKHFILNNPNLESEIDFARHIIKRLNINTREIDDGINDEIWQQIQAKIKPPQKKIHISIKWIAAASIALFMGIGGSVFYLSRNLNSPDYSAIARAEPASGGVKLILSDNSEKFIDSDEPSIDYSEHGEVAINSTILEMGVEKEKKNSEVFNQLVVPKGKRSKLTLSDGTKIFLNSGSRVIYPVAFNKKKREIYIEGEAYLDVKHNMRWPFFVKTSHLKVRVLGTEFNVKAYPDEANTSVVLVEGCVQAVAETGKVLMEESELLTVQNETGNTRVEKANVIEYISWKNGWMYCNNETIESIAKKLSRYYDVNIRFNGDEVKELTTTGKLDLKSKCTDVLSVISFTAPISYEVTSEEIIISTK